MKRIKATPELMDRIRKAREELAISRKQNLMAQEEAERKKILNEAMQQNPVKLAAIKARRNDIINGRAFPKIRMVVSDTSAVSTDASTDTGRTNSVPFRRGRLAQPTQSTASMDSKESSYAIPMRPTLPGCASPERVKRLIEARSGSYSANTNSFLSNKNSSGFVGKTRKTVAQQRTPK